MALRADPSLRDKKGIKQAQIKTKYGRAQYRASDRSALLSLAVARISPQAFDISLTPQISIADAAEDIGQVQVVHRRRRQISWTWPPMAEIAESAGAAAEQPPPRRQEQEDREVAESACTAAEAAAGGHDFPAGGTRQVAFCHIRKSGVLPVRSGGPTRTEPSAQERRPRRVAVGRHAGAPSGI